MDELEQELYDMVSLKLLCLSSRKNYPIEPSIALWCFFQGLQDHFYKRHQEEKLTIEHSNFCKEAIFTLKSEDGATLADGAIGYEDVLRGNNSFSRSSHMSLTTSHYLVYHLLGENLSKEEHLNVIRDTDQLFLSNFGQYQENMLLPVSLDKYVMPDNPFLFYKILEEYPLEVYRDSLITEFSRPRKGGPSVRTLLHDKEWDFDDDYHPSKSSMERLFWINYIYELAKDKSYPYRKNDVFLMKKDDILYYLEEKEESALMEGKEIPQFNSH